MAKPTITMPNTTMGKHGRLREEEAARVEAHEPKGADPDRSAFDQRMAKVAVGEPYPPTAPKTEKCMSLDDFEAELKSKYPDDDIQLRGLDNGNHDILIGGKAIPISRDKIESLTSKSDLGAYIDSLKVK